MDSITGHPIATGRTAEVYALDGRRVAKVLRPGFPDGLGEAEARAAQVVTASGIAAPRFLGTARMDGRFVLLYERCDGASMLEALERRPWGYGRQASEFGRVHAESHAAEGVGLPSLRTRLAQVIARTDTPTWRDAALRRLEGLPDGNALLHGDFHPGNVLLSANGPTVIDWEAAAAGPPAAGVAHTLLLLRASALPAEISGVRRRAIGLLRRAFVRSYLRAYRRLRPVDGDEVHAWRLPILVARLDDGIQAEQLPLRRAIERELSAGTVVASLDRWT